MYDGEVQVNKREEQRGLPGADMKHMICLQTYRVR